MRAPLPCVMVLTILFLSPSPDLWDAIVAPFCASAPITTKLVVADGLFAAVAVKGSTDTAGRQTLL